MTRTWFDKTAQLGRTALALAFVLLSASVALPATARDGQFTHGLLWRIESEGAAPSFIFGTLHSADPEIATPFPALQRVLESVDSLTIELVIDEEAKQVLGRSMLLTDGRRLRDITGAERFKRIAAAGARYGIPAEHLDVLTPWGAMTIFSLPPSEILKQAAGAVALDAALEAAAQQRGISVYGIETIEEQVSVFSGMSEDDQLALLDSTLDSNDRIDTFFDRMRQAYLAGDLERLNALTQEEAESVPEAVIARFLDRLIFERNRRMAERIRPRLAEGNALIAVGALHLYGEQGVLGLLAAQGYRVSRVE